jgi:hypothetical protein
LARKHIKRSKGAEPNSENVDRALTFAKYYASNVYCAITPVDFRVQFLNEKIKYEDGWFYTADAMVILNPRAAKKLGKFLDEAIKTYEAEHGVIDLAATNEEPY